MPCAQIDGCNWRLREIIGARLSAHSPPYAPTEGHKREGLRGARPTCLFIMVGWGWAPRCGDVCSQISSEPAGCTMKGKHSNGRTCSWCLWADAPLVPRGVGVCRWTGTSWRSGVACSSTSPWATTHASASAPGTTTS